MPAVPSPPAQSAWNTKKHKETDIVNTNTMEAIKEGGNVLLGTLSAPIFNFEFFLWVRG